MDMIRWFVHEPILGGVVLLCLLLVGAIILSDWLEKRRTRQFLQIRDELKELHRRQKTPADGLMEASETASVRTAREQRPVFKLFRWEFALLSTLLVALWGPNKLTQPVLVQARTLHQSAKAAKTNVSHETSSLVPGLTPAIDAPPITLQRASTCAAPNTITFRLAENASAIGLFECDWNMLSDESNHSVATVFEAASVDESDWDTIDNRSKASALQNNFPIAPKTQFTALLEDSSRGRFSR